MPIRTIEDEGGRAKMKVLTLEEENSLRAVGNLPSFRMPPFRRSRAPLIPAFRRRIFRRQLAWIGTQSRRFPPFPFGDEQAAT
jgi:hypothetical protein